MNRRDFLRSIGLTTAALAVAPTNVLAPPDFYEGYPPLQFTGLRGSQISDEFAGDMSWAVLWEDETREDLTFWSYKLRISKLEATISKDIDQLLSANVNPIQFRTPQ